MLRLYSTAIAAAVSLGLAAPAHAAFIVGAFEGQILSGTATSDYFTGTAGDDLSTFADNGPAGLITGRFSYDSLFPDSGGGSFGGEGVNWLGFEVTIAGKTYTFGSFAPTFDYQSAFVADGPDTFNLQYVREGGAGMESINIGLSDEEFLTGSILPESFDYSSPVGGIGSLVIQNGNVEADALFTITSVQAGVVPEPEMWVTLILGFGFVGGILRSARRLEHQRAGSSGEPSVA